MDNITNMIEYNDYCNKLYISYITKHFEFIKFYCLIHKLLSINTKLTDDNSMVNILSILDNSNIDNSTFKKLIEQQTKLTTRIEKLKNLTGNHPEIDRMSASDLDKLVERLDNGDEQCEHLNIELEKIKQTLDTTTEQLNKTKIELKTSLEMKSQLDILKSKISNLENEKQVLNNALESYKNTKTQMGEIEIQLKKCNDTLLQDKTNAQELNQEISKLKKQIMELQQRLDKQNKISSKDDDELTARMVHRDDMTNKRQLEAARVNREIKDSADGNIAGVNTTTGSLILGNKQKINYSYDRVLSNNVSKPLNLSNFNCEFSNNKDRKNKSLVETKENQLMKLILQTGDSDYYKTIYNSLLKRYQDGSNQERMDIHGESWGNLDFCKSKTIEWFCRYAKAGLIHHLLEDLIALNKARDEINNWCKRQQTLKGQCPSPWCKTKKTGKCRRKRSYYSNIKDDTSKELRNQLYPVSTEREKVKHL